MEPGLWRDTIRWEVAHTGTSYEVTEFFNDVPMGSPRYFDNQEQVDAYIESERHTFKAAQILSLARNPEGKPKQSLTGVQPPGPEAPAD